MSGDKDSFERGLVQLAEEMPGVLARIVGLCQAPLMEGETILAVAFGLLVGTRDGDVVDYRGLPGTEFDVESEVDIVGLPMGIGEILQQMNGHARAEIARRNAGGDVVHD